MAIHRFQWGTSADAQVSIVQLGSKSTPKIAHGLRSLGLQSWIMTADAFKRAPGHKNLKAIILSGGNKSVYDADAPHIPVDLLERYRSEGVYIIAICFGAQEMASQYGGIVRRAPQIESGVTRLSLIPFFEKAFGAYRGGKVVMNHGDEVVKLPAGWERFGSTPECAYALFGTNGILCSIPHLEMSDTEHGMELFRHLLYDCAGCVSDFSFDPYQFKKEAEEFIRERAQGRKILVALSGGVDSSVSYTLAKQALGGECMRAVCIDNGFLRDGELDQIKNIFGSERIFYIDAREEFYKSLEAIPYPGFADEPSYFKEVRKTIRKVFVNVFARAAKETGAEALVQGTNKADVIETTEGLKEHHNVLDEIEGTLAFDVIEPLPDLFKDEIRILARVLGLPDEIAEKQPFPGPGNSIRLWGQVTREKARLLGRANRILEEVVRKHYPRHHDRPHQYYVAFIPLLTRALIGDEGRDGYMLYVRAVTSDGPETYITAQSFRFTESAKQEIDWRLRKEVVLDDGTPIVDVVFSKTSKPPRNVEPH